MRQTLSTCLLRVASQRNALFLQLLNFCYWTETSLINESSPIESLQTDKDFEGSVTSYLITIIAVSSSVVCLAVFLILVAHSIKGYANLQKFIILLTVSIDLATSILTTTSNWIIPELHSPGVMMISCSWTWTSITLLNCYSAWMLVTIVLEVHDTLVHSQIPQLTRARLSAFLAFTAVMGLCLAFIPIAKVQDISSFGLHLLSDNQTIVCSIQQNGSATQFDRVFFFLQSVAVVLLPVLAVILQALNIGRYAATKMRTWRQREAAKETRRNRRRRRRRRRSDSISLETTVEFLRSRYFKLIMGIVFVKFVSQPPYIVATTLPRIITFPLTVPIIVTQMISQIGILISSILYYPLLSAMNVVHWKEALPCYHSSAMPEQYELDVEVAIHNVTSVPRTAQCETV